MTKNVRVGIVGAGGIVRTRHVPGFQALDGVSLDAVVNRTEASSLRAAQEFGIARVHHTWRDLVADPELDAVLVGTWPYLHAPITVAALEAGKHVLVQARLAMDAPEARAIASAAARRPDLIAMVVPAPFTFWADECVQRLLREDVIGELRTARVFWGGGDGVFDPGPAWRRERRFSGNNVLALGIVYESVARWLGHTTWVQAATALVDHSATVDVPDVVSLIAGLPGGAQLSLDMSPHARFGGPNRVELFGSQGALLVDLDHQRLRLRREDSNRFVESDVAPRENERADWRVEAEFIGAIRDEEPVRLTDVPTAVRYMEFTDAVRQSAKTGRRIPL
jgi:predicted dehydrogenase